MDSLGLRSFAALARPGLQPVRCCRSRRCIAAVAAVARAQRAQSRWTQQTGLVSVIFYSSASQGMTGGPMASLPYIYRLRIQIGRFHCGAGGGCMACLHTSHLNWAVLFGLLSLQHDKAKTAEKVSNHPCLSWCRPWHCGRGRWSALATARNKVHQRLLRFHCLDLGHKQQAHYCTVTTSSACYRAAPSLADLLRNYAF